MLGRPIRKARAASVRCLHDAALPPGGCLEWAEVDHHLPVPVTLARDRLGCWPAVAGVAESDPFGLKVDPRWIPSVLLGLDPGDRLHAVDRPVEGEHAAHTRGLGTRDQIGLGKVKPVELVDLKRPQQQ